MTTWAVVFIKSENESKVGGQLPNLGGFAQERDASCAIAFLDHLENLLKFSQGWLSRISRYPRPTLLFEVLPLVRA